MAMRPPLNARSKRLNRKTIVTPAEGEQDDSTIFGTLFDLPPEHKNTGPPHKECTVCLDALSKTFFPESLHSEQHSSDVCFKCYDEHIESELYNKHSERISCPQCPQTLTEPEIRKLTQRAVTYQKYGFRALRSARSV